MARSQIQYGSQGDDVKELQKILNQNGYNLTEDGIFGSNTQNAVKDYQKKYGLDVDGIVGTNTWASLTNGSTSTDSFKYDDFKYDDFKYGEYKESDTVKQAQDALNTQLAQKPGEYKSQWQAQLDDVINKIMNREKFSYDLNGDALYQQYKDKYIQQGKMAMGDAIGQASAMTGGYGNSYAQSVGQQAYQAQLENLNDIVPELYQMAYDKYNQEGQDLYNQYSMLGQQEEQDYGRYRDSVNDWQTERDYLAGRFDSERDYDYSKYNNERDFAYGQYADDRNFAYSKYADGKNYAYQAYRDAIEDERWEKEFAEAQRQFDEQMALKTSSGESSGGGSSGGGSSSGGSSGGSGSGTGTGGNNGSGNNGSGNTTASKIPDSIMQKVATFTDNKSLETYLENLEATGTITHDQALQLMAEYMDANEVYTSNDDGSTTISYKDMIESTNGWEVISDGGVNLLGIDANAIVKAPNGQQIRLDNLREKLKEEGMSHSDATNAIKKLQQNLDISSNWLFGW